MLPAKACFAEASNVITITGAADHDRPDWLITMTGIRTLLEVAWDFLHPCTPKSVGKHFHPTALRGT
jgi:hypothetical protein